MKLSAFVLLSFLEAGLDGSGMAQPPIQCTPAGLEQYAAERRPSLAQRGVLGLQLEVVTTTAPGLPSPRFLVHGVLPGSPGQAAGVKEGDWVVRMGSFQASTHSGEAKAAEEELHRYLESLRAGQEVELGFFRGTERYERKAVLVPPSQEAVEKWIDWEIGRYCGAEALSQYRFSRRFPSATAGKLIPLPSAPPALPPPPSPSPEPRF